jgi:purine nucleosidase
MQSQWKLQTYLNMSDYPILLSESRPLNPFPIEYRSDSIKVYNSRLLQGLPDNPQWPGDYQSGEAFLKAQLIRAVETGNPLTLVITNPLTPLSMVLKENPSLEKGIKRVIWMGGAINVPGNLDPNTLPVQIANPKAEWNAFWDPYAVDWIFRHTSVPLLVFPLDVTDQAKVTAEFTAALKQQAQQYRYSDLVESLYSLVENQPYFEMWNSLTAVFVGKPEIFEDPTPMRLNIVDEGYMQGTITQGATGRQALVYLNIKDKPGFYNYVLGQLLRN